ncbi:hypothetical protein B4U80_08047 [Leptotrombidium deliense]|uniref:Dynein light chain Tctex-type 1-like protein n=1 Tax=Leptotrombidium deliense TaxID=299467 RepID=A0A443SGD9_9ACAR|nr:hypothetical protein B4U80_08047 [Leptotrombidium deliense]
MEISEESSTVTLNTDDLQKYAKEAIEGVLGSNSYQHTKVNQWSNAVSEQLIAQLTKTSKAFKYIVTCVIVQKTGAGVNTSTSCFWDSTTDTSCIVRWENKSLHCIVQVFALAI